MSKFLYPIKNLKIETWLKYYLLNKNNEKLPSEYQQVDYIESSGTQYIDTGFKMKGSSKSELVFSNTPIVGTVKFFMGARYNVSASKKWALANGVSGANNKLQANYGNSSIINTNDVIDNFDVQNKNNIIIDKGKLFINNNLISSVDEQEFEADYNLYLFCINQADTPYNNSTMKLYTCKIYDNDTLVRDFIPCYRKSDEEVGLYDLVTKTFFTNQGTGAFTKGDDI